MYTDMARENMESFARVGRRTVRVPFYSRELWLSEHPGFANPDYLDWLLLLDMLEDQVREEGLEVEEVPFSRERYASWLAGGAERCDNSTARAEYLRSLSTADIRDLQRGADLRPQAPIAQATTAAVFLLPFAVDEEAYGAIGRLGANLPQMVVDTLAHVVQASMDLDLDLEILSPVRSMGVSVHVYPRLVSAADFDGSFGARYLDWMKSCVQAGAVRRVPRARKLAEARTDCLGLCVAAFGAGTQVERFDAISFDDDDRDRLTASVSQALGLGPGALECADVFAERSRAEESCMEFMGCLLEDAVDEGAAYINDEPDEEDFKLLSLLQNPPKPIAGRMGVLIPFTARDRG